MQRTLSSSSLHSQAGGHELELRTATIMTNRNRSHAMVLLKKMFCIHKQVAQQLERRPAIIMNNSRSVSDPDPNPDPHWIRNQ
jgi:hypothetical protein